jgi:hypothetical protein
LIDFARTVGRSTTTVNESLGRKLIAKDREDRSGLVEEMKGLKRAIHSHDPGGHNIPKQYK